MRVVGYWNKISDKLAKQGAMKNMYEGGRESGGGGGGEGGRKKLGTYYATKCTRLCME